MSGRKRRSERDRRRRSLGQNFLVDQRLIERLIDDLRIVAGELIVDLGAGAGALTLPMARAGAQVVAVEGDPAWSQRLLASTVDAGLDGRVRLIRCDLRRFRFPTEPFRVVANPPFALTTEILGLLLDDPASSLIGADLILQREVARKHAARPPKALKTASWAPWWQFTLGRRVPASAFRPRPSVDAALLSIVRREPSILPAWLGPGFVDLLRPAWQPPRS